MASTVIAGKPSNTVGEKNSTLILQGSSVKILWGNKFIDLIKNGKINAEADKILKTAESVDDIKSDGIYLIKDSVWAVIGGTKIELNAKETTTYISYVVELDLDNEQKERSLTNIGFYYDTYEEAFNAGLTKGIIYVQEDNKLYFVKNGKLNVYGLSEEDKEVDYNKVEKDLYIKDCSLWVNDKEAVLFDGDNIILKYKLIADSSGIESFGATSLSGFRLYIDDLGRSVLEIDNIIWRHFPIPITFEELYENIRDKTLQPKMYYLITDFQNPWEVTWDDEDMFYEDYYDELGRLAGKRNAQQLVVLARTNNTLEKEAVDLLHPDWVIYYDPVFLGPEHIINEDNILYGYRNRTDENGNLIYLPCKGRITYLKDDFGNEGNFNFRCHLFKRNNNWRYCMDANSGGKFGKFLEGKNNTFLFGSIETYIQVFMFDPTYDSENNITGYTLRELDSNILISEGHNILITKLPVENNHFELPSIFPANHTITLSILYNKFINISKNITIDNEAFNNSFVNLSENLHIKIVCNDNVINSFSKDVIITGTEFNGNNLYNFSQPINNSGKFSYNTINKCVGVLNNLNNCSYNTILSIDSDLTITKVFKENDIKVIKNTQLLGNVIHNTILEIYRSNIEKDFLYNKFKCVIDNTKFKGITLDNISISDINNCEFKDFIDNKIYELLSDIKSENIVNTIFNLTVTSLTSKDLFNCNFYIIEDLTLDIPVYYTTFHGRIGNIDRELTEFEKELLLDSTKKTDVYPNIRVICVPEIIIAGMIIMWHGTEIPKGWAICNGKNGTPDLRNRFIRSVDIDDNGNILENPGEVNPEEISEKNEYTLSVDNLPEHVHNNINHVHDIPELTSSSEFVSTLAWRSLASGTDITDGFLTKNTDYVTTQSSTTGNAIFDENNDNTEWKNLPIKIEPRHYKLIFIMKIDEDLEESNVNEI